MNKVWIIVGLVLIIGLGAWKLMDNKKEVAQKVYRPNPNEKVGVRVEKAEATDLSQNKTFLGSFVANREVQVTPIQGGTIVQLPVREGQSIGAGQLIAKIDDAQLRFQLEGLQVSLEGAKNDLQRYENLVKGDASPAINVEKTKLTIRSTEAQIKQLKNQIANTIVTAPFAGIVTQKMVEKGSVAGAGSPLVKITDIATLKLLVSVPEKAVNQFRVGQPITVHTEVYPNSPYSGRVSVIGVQGDAAHNYPVEVTVANSTKNPLRAGMYGSVQNKTELSRQTLTVPRQAIVGSLKQPQVFVVAGGKAQLRSVQIGTTTNDRYEIRQGLQAGESVVVSGQINLQDGTPVTIL
ncbi:efflux RND transporter periplasmic adaptor subunit [Spirosoma oryzicola]|uniref:efflux RND transporter periplasmic adaptor subunit n=1 Tax=Spirosoma oryzicola TaxID=2898794 RepID=UPI001E41E48D|nr:efflux RND transporter periplasmic adaptor subunit [Spirosoma oryzicola]UHG94716.1 efflux RND transporter periplasmic adaptor subunit [Spirosoma oryzicola]